MTLEVTKFVAFQTNTAYCTKLKLALRHARRIVGWIGLLYSTTLNIYFLCQNLGPKRLAFLKGVAKWTVAPLIVL